MYIDINDISKKKNSSKTINVSIDSEDALVGNREIKAKDKISFVGSAQWNEELIMLQGRITGLLSLTCSRCLDVFEYPIDIEVNEKISTVPNDEDDTIIFIDSDKINLNELIENNILMSLPIKKLCDEDCKGLCQSCGGNLNKKTCNCDNHNVDPRLAKLKDLFFTD